MKARILALAIFLEAVTALAPGEDKVFLVHTAGMAPTIPANSKIKVVLDENYRKRIARFDIVVFTLEAKLTGKTLQLKRVIGLPGEKVEIREETVLIDDKPIELPASVQKEGLIYKTPNWQRPVKTIQIMPSDAVFVLGDNAGDSVDSRILGPLKLSDIVGYYAAGPKEPKTPDGAGQP